MTDDSPRDDQQAVTINDLVDEFVVALVNTRIYWNEHPRVSASISEIRRILPLLGEATRKSAVEILIAEDRLVYEQRPLLGASISAPRLIKAIDSRNGGGLSIACDAGEDEFRVLFKLLVERTSPDRPIEELNAELAERGCPSVRLLEKRSSQVDPRVALLRRVPVQLHQGLVEILQDTTISLCHGGVIQFDRSKACIEGVLRSLRSEDPGALLNAVRYERYDAYTFGHSIRVALLALEFTRTLTDDEGLLNRIGVAALLHDVGKVRVPFEVLHCRTRLDADQRYEMEKHPTYGAEILLDHCGCDPMAYGAAFGHHLGNAGGGYPHMLHNAEISLITRIVKICDVFEALTAVRPYKPGMPPVRAFRIMMDMGETFDRALLKRFIRSIGAYPTGTRVELGSGEVARVMRQSGHLLRPVVELEAADNGEPLSDDDRRVIDTSAESGAFAVTRVVSLDAPVTVG